jgi:2-(1,2-epoxy-1,2-dihydrophenyl)acetyl-CoA isomerase
MGEELVAAFRALRDDDAVRAVILAGAGEGFCAGVDLDALKSEPRLGEGEFVRGFALELADYPKPLIAAIQGAAVGVGVTMVLPADVRVAADDARLGLTFAKLGILPGLGSTHLLPRLVGLGRALELVLSARLVPAEEACAIGLVHRVVPRDALLASAREIAEQTLACDPAALAAAKRALHAGAVSGMAEAMEHEREASAALRAARATRDG